MAAILHGRSRRTKSLAPNYVILTILILFSLLPLLTLVFNSVKSDAEVNSNPLGPPMMGIRLQNYIDAWNAGHLSVSMVNSAFLAFGTIAGVIVVAGMAAYALAKLNLPGSNYITLYLLVGTSMPSQLFMVPLFFLWTKLGLSDKLIGVIIIFWALQSPFATFLLRSYMISIPKDFEDAARVDGASEVQVLRHVIVPLSLPGFLTVGLVVGLGAWNEFLFAVTFLHHDNVKPISTSLYAFISRYDRQWGLTSAAAMIMVLPVLILFLSLQRQFIEGLTQGGLKA
jgi:raffinose/stachyose/melibiose transport system permease protein